MRPHPIAPNYRIIILKNLKKLHILRLIDIDFRNFKS